MTRNGYTLHLSMCFTLLSEKSRLMRRVILTTCVLFAACVTLQRCDYSGAPTTSSGSAPKPPVAGSPYVGNLAPGFTVKSVNNETVDLSALRGKVVLLAFFGTSG